MFTERTRCEPGTGTQARILDTAPAGKYLNINNKRGTGYTLSYTNTRDSQIKRFSACESGA